MLSVSRNRGIVLTNINRAHELRTVKEGRGDAEGGIRRGHGLHAGLEIFLFVLE